MSNKEQLLNVVFVFIATAALGAILGLSILRTVDTRLSEVSINIPQIKIPRVKVEWPKQIESLPSFAKKDFYGSLQENYAPMMTGGAKDEADKGDILYKKSSKDDNNRASRNKQDLSDGSTELRKQLDGPDFKRQRDVMNNSNYYLAAQQMESHKVSNYPPIHPHRSHQDIDHHEANRQYLGRPKKRSSKCAPHQYIGDGYLDQPCNDSKPILYEGQQHYKNPVEMTERQVLKFKQNAKFDKMTARDYMNWLSLYANEPEILTPHNRKMLKRFKKRIPLTERDIPRETRLPKNSRELYNELRDP